MGVTELAKIKISNRLCSSAKSAFFKWQTQVASEGGGVSFIPWVPNFKNGEPYFFPESSLVFSRAKKSKFCWDNALENKFIFAQNTLFFNWTRIVGQSWFESTLGCWPQNFRIKILKYTFSLVYEKIIPIRPMVQKIIGDNFKTDRQLTDLLALQVCFNHLLLLQGDNLQKLFSFNIYICRGPTLIGKLQQQQQAQKLEGWGERERWGGSAGRKTYFR